MSPSSTILFFSCTQIHLSEIMQTKARNTSTQWIKAWSDYCFCTSKFSLIPVEHLKNSYFHQLVLRTLYNETNIFPKIMCRPFFHNQKAMQGINLNAKNTRIKNGNVSQPKRDNGFLPIRVRSEVVLLITEQEQRR